jgi:hypothetical protein
MEARLGASDVTTKPKPVPRKRGRVDESESTCVPDPTVPDRSTGLASHAICEEGSHGTVLSRVVCRLCELYLSFRGVSLCCAFCAGGSVEGADSSMTAQKQNVVTNPGQGSPAKSLNGYRLAKPTSSPESTLALTKLADLKKGSTVNVCVRCVRAVSFGFVAKLGQLIVFMHVELFHVTSLSTQRASGLSC